MKQTNNAIKFLMAQYRAIFKNAYFKGMATALVLTAGLAAGANTAQAADDNWYYTTSSTDDTSDVTKWSGNGTKPAGSTGNAAGALDFGTSGSDSSGNIVALGDGIATGGQLDIGASGDTIEVTTVSGNAYGGLAIISSGSMTAIAHDNKANLYSGGVVNGHLVGGWAKQAGDGTAQAYLNSVTVSGDATTSSLSVGNQVIGAWASSKHGATAYQNTVTISGGMENRGLNFDATGGIYGAQVWADKGAVEGNYTAQSNGVSITNVTLNNASGTLPVIAGGHVYANDASGSGQDVNVATFNASNNTITLNNVLLNKPTTASSWTIAGNFVEHNFLSNASSAERFIANGDGSTPTLDIKNSTINNVTAYGASITAGNSSTEGSIGDISATGNVVSITNTDVLSSAIYGAAVSSKARAAQSLTLTNNSVTIAANEGTTNHSFKGTSVFGAQISNDFSHAADAGASAAASQLTISNNTINIGAQNDFIYTDQDGNGGWTKGTDTASNVYGVQLVSSQPGINITADNNSVTFDGHMTGNGNDFSTDLTGDSLSGLIVGVHNASANGATITNTKVSIGNNAQVTDGVIAAVYDTPLDDADTSTYNNNSVNIANGAKITRTDVYAVFYSDDTKDGTYPNLLAGKTATLNSSVKTAGTHVDSSIYGGAGSGSVVSLENGSLFKVSPAGEEVISSDVINLAGQMEVGNGATVTVKGFATNGNQTATTVNSNQTDIAASARIYNKGTVELLGKTTVADSATLSAMSTGALLKVNGDSTHVDNTANSGDIFTDFVGGTAELIISSDNLKSYLTAGDKYTIDETTGLQEDYAGTAQITSGGILHFTDASIDISKFDYNTTAEAGKIHVDPANGTSIIKGDDVTVSHKFASNGSANVKYEALAGITSQGISVEANSLTLGSTALSSTQSENLTFYKATARDEINFVAMTSGADIGEDGKAITTQYNDGYHLTSQVIGSHYMLTNSQDGKLQYYTAQDGVVNGPVTITEVTGKNPDSGELVIQNGHWTANGQITMASGGTLTVGGVGGYDGIDHAASGIDNSPDATLTLNQDLVLNVSSTGGDSTINVTGNDGDFDVLDYADELDGTVSVATDRVALLDLRNGLIMQGTTTTVGGVTSTTYDHKATFNVTNQGIVLLNADDVNTILAQNDRVDAANQSNSGTFFKASAGGAFIVDGDVTADFGDFSTNQNGFNLTGTGTLAANKLTVAHDNEVNGEHADAEYIKGDTAVHFGGTVRVADLEINDLQLTTGENKPSNYASQVVVADGTAYISKSLTSYNSTMILGTESSAGTDFIFHTDAVEDTGTIDVDTLRVDKGSVSVTNGIWTADAINLSGAGTSLTVGDGDLEREDVDGNDTYASLTATSLTMAQDSELNVLADGTAKFTNADFTKLDSATTTTDASVVVDGSLTVSDSVKFGGEGSILINKNGVLAFGDKATNANIVKDGDYRSANATLITASGSGSFTKIRNLGGELHLGLSAGTVFGGDQIRTLKSQLFTADSFTGSTLEDRVLINGGVLNIGDATFEGVKVSELVGEGLSGYTATWESLRGFSDIFGNDVTNDTLVQTNVSGIKPGDNIQGHWGSLSMESGVAPSAQVEIAGDTSLNFAAGNNGFFISSADHKSALGANIQGQKDLTLENGGTIGKITMQPGKSDAEKNWTVLNVVGANKTTIDSIIGESNATGNDAHATLVSIQGGETEITNNLQYIDEVEVLNGASLNVKGNADIGSIFTLNSDATFAQTLTVDDGVIAGGITKAKDIVFNGDGDIINTAIDSEDFSSVDVVNGGTLKAETFTFKKDVINSGNGALFVGHDFDETESVLEDGTKITGTGYLEISNYLDLNGGTLVVDPAYGEATSVAAVMNFKDGNDSTYETELNDVGIVNGSALIGKNAALGIGATLAETQEAIAKYQTNGSLSEKDYGSILYLNGQVTLTADAEIALNSAATVNTVEGIRDSLKYNLKQETDEDLRQDQYADLGLGANTAILMTEQAFISDTKGTKNGVAITFDQTNAVVNGQGGDIVLIGSFDAKDPLNFFMDKDGEGHQGALIAGQDINVYTQNGFLYTVLKAGTEAGYGEQLKVDTDRAYAVMNEASNPVVETLISYHVDRGGAVAGDTTTESTEDNNSGSSSIGGNENTPLTPLTNATAQNNTASDGAPIVDIGSSNTENTGDTTTPVEGNGNGGGAEVEGGNNGGNGGAQQPAQPSSPTTRVTGSSDFLNEVVTTSHGAPAEAAARLAIYGGAVQAAMAATSSTTDAIAARMGVGNTANITMANNGQGAALWLAPVYKTHDSDSFESQGLDYGVDLNLYGVALGADFEFMPGLKAGIMFNVGSGDADGQGNAAANNTSNDFDYWGAAIYGNYTYDALSVTADVSYTAVDNDLEATTSMQQFTKLESSTDTTAISLGVTAKYTFDFGGVEVAPHAGLRYTNIDLDDYSIKSNGETVADYSADKVNIFSIPVGVTFAKEFTGDAWTVKPSLDLTLTGNFGDDDISGDVSWTGVDGLVTPVSSEYMDDFTYGATLGIEAASNGGFSLGLGVNYTGSSNVDEFGVNANARFVF